MGFKGLRVLGFRFQGVKGLGSRGNTPSLWNKQFIRVLTDALIFRNQAGLCSLEWPFGLTGFASGSVKSVKRDRKGIILGFADTGPVPCFRLFL